MRELFTGVLWRVRFAYKKSIKHLSREDMIGAHIENGEEKEKIHRKNHRCRHDPTTAIYDTKHRGEDHNGIDDAWTPKKGLKERRRVREKWHEVEFISSTKKDSNIWCWVDWMSMRSWERCKISGISSLFVSLGVWSIIKELLTFGGAHFDQILCDYLTLIRKSLIKLLMMAIVHKFNYSNTISSSLFLTFLLPPCCHSN